MHERMRRALFEMYDRMDDAGARQEERGGYDQGERSKVTSGKHLDVVTEVIVDDLMAAGYREEDLVWGGRGATIPGWFRAAKDWDLLAFDGDYLLAAVELKSINSSFGNNANNRAEEAIGEAVDANYAIRNDLISYQVHPPVLGYVMVARYNDESDHMARNKRAVYPVDRVFHNTTYLDRFEIMGRRLLQERIYQAVWVVFVDVEGRLIIEPDANLCYDVFIETLISQHRIASAMR